jgi:DnaA N-terminal domain
MSDVDRMRIEAVKKLERMGFTWTRKMWMPSSLDKFHRLLFEEVGEEHYECFGSGVVVEGVAGGVLTVSMPTRFLKWWVEDQYVEDILKVAQRVYGDIERVEMVVERVCPMIPQDLKQRVEYLLEELED